MFSKLAGAVIAAALTFSAGSASAAVVLDDLPSSTYITVGGLDWTWAAPVSSVQWLGANTLSDPSLHAGWRLATDAEWAARPDQAAFKRADGSIIQSAIYWNSNFSHVDFGDQLTNVLNLGGPDARDIWYVRDVVSGAVPEPATWAMMIIGFGAAGSAVRSGRRRRALATA